MVNWLYRTRWWFKIAIGTIFLLLSLGGYWAIAYEMGWIFAMAFLLSVAILIPAVLLSVEG